MVKKIIYIFFIFLVSSPFFVLARENVDYWYIKDFQSEIIVNKDSSLLITEKIIADCGQGINKHGIFRILPTKIKLANGQKIKNPVKLISITDFSGQPLNYVESENKFDGTITWKIGDPNKTVQGENYYLIKYRVENAIRFSNFEFDELYWNLSGNFWDLQIDNFSAQIIFPGEVLENNSQIYLYSGSLGEKSNEKATYNWILPNILKVNSDKTLLEGEGITISAAFPKNIFTPYQPGFWELYGNYFSFLISISAFILCFYFWNKYGRDPKSKNPVIAEYEPPLNLSPLELGALKTNGMLKNEFITAEIINLAVNGHINIKEIDKKVLVFHSRDFEISKAPGGKKEASAIQKVILENIFEGRNAVMLSELKNKFYKCLKEVKEKTIDFLAEKNLFIKSSLKWRAAFVFLGVILIGAGIGAAIASQNLFWGLNIAVSGLLFIIFNFIMPKRTIEGAEAFRQIKGFKLYMETAEKYRSQFYEKENIFEKFLPYAIAFGITGLWIKKMKEIYGEEFYSRYSPAWYAGNFGAFSADSLNSVINNLSSGIASNISSPSGSGGAGGAGGGGGGGGGGGW